MAPAKASNKWDDEDSSTPPSSPPAPAVARRSKFDDEEEDSDVLESWSAAEDSEVEAEKAKAAAEKKAKADAEAAANKKSKAQRAQAHAAARKRLQEEEDDLSSDEDEDESSKRERLRRTEQEADLQHAEDLMGNIGISSKRSGPRAIVHDATDPEKIIDLSALPLFNPSTKDGFAKLRETLAPVLSANTKKAQYTLFLQDLTKQLAKELPSDQIKKIASGLTTLGNEKMKEEKLAEKGGKKSKAQKTKTSLVASRDVAGGRDTTAYDDDGLDDGDFM